jgi:acyl dehydratase
MLRHEAPQPHDSVRVAPFHADRRVGRRYGRVSGDLNPIHLADTGARLFGFDRAVAHGMWSMARSLAALDADTWDVPAAVDVQFKLPLFLPSGVQLHHWRQGDRTVFVLKDAAGARPHLAGSVSRPAPA